MRYYKSLNQPSNISILIQILDLILYQCFELNDKYFRHLIQDILNILS